MSVLTIARFELAESLRSRKVLVFLVLYIAGSVGATVIFTEFLQTVEEALAEQLLVARTNTPGSLTQAVMESPELLRVLRGLVRDDRLAASLVRIPPVALLYHWVALAFGPVFVMLTSSDAISSEVASGSIRFSLVRSGRAEWVAGKVLGQATLLGVGLCLGALGAWVTGAVQLMAFDGGATAGWLSRYVGSALAFSLSFLGLATMASQLTRSVAGSRALGLILLVGAFAIPRALESDPVIERAPVLAESLRQLFPIAHRLDLWRPSTGAVMGSATILICLGVAFVGIGYARFARRDA